MPVSGYVAVAVWFFGLMIFAGRSLNFLRVVLNNIRPGESYLGSGYMNPLAGRFGMSATAVDSAKLNEKGRHYQGRAVLNERLMLAWGLIGIVLIAGYFTYVQPLASESPPDKPPQNVTTPAGVTAATQSKQDSGSTAASGSAANSHASRNGAKYLVATLFGIWLAGLLFLALQSRHQVRLALQHRHPEARFSEFTSFGFRKLARAIDPARLNEAGQIHLKHAIKSERLLLLWMLDGPLFILLPAAGLLS